MIVNLLCDCEFFPIFSKSIIRHLLSLYDFYELSPQGLKSRLAIIVQDYLFKIQDQKMTQVLRIAICDRDQGGDFVKTRTRMSTAVRIFYEIEKLASNDSEKSDLKCIKLFINKDDPYTLPLTAIDDVTSLEEAMDFAAQIAKLIAEATNDKEFRVYVKKLLDLSKQSPQKTKSKKSASKTETPKKKKESTEIKNLFISINSCLSELFATTITASFEELQKDYSHFFYLDLESLRASVSPDFVGEIVTFLNSESRELLQKRPGFKQFIQSVQEYNIGIDINQCLLVFNEAVNSLKETAANKRIKANLDMLFYLYVSEMKYIGLISERGRGKMCFQKDYFAKTFHNTANLNEEEDDDM